ncbi:hypothetical protein KJ763_03065 [Patescibacteria group bacterium]|nr:hypothetical protein [Patescibacteria group bacterium]
MAHLVNQYEDLIKPHISKGELSGGVRGIMGDCVTRFEEMIRDEDWGENSKLMKEGADTKYSAIIGYFKMLIDEKENSIIEYCFLNIDRRVEELELILNSDEVYRSSRDIK